MGPASTVRMKWGAEPRRAGQAVGRGAATLFVAREAGGSFASVRSKVLT